MLMMHCSVFKNHHVYNSEVYISIFFNSIKRKTIINAKLSCRNYCRSTKKHGVSIDAFSKYCSMHYYAIFNYTDYKLGKQYILLNHCTLHNFSNHLHIYFPFRRSMLFFFQPSTRCLFIILIQLIISDNRFSFD
jgi:hypothetical protein